MEQFSIKEKDMREFERFMCISKQIEALDMFDDVNYLATALIHEDPDLTSLTDEQIKTLMWLNTVMTSNNRSAEMIAKAVFIGAESIKNTIAEISTLLKTEIEKINTVISSNPEYLLISSTRANNVYSYLQSIGLSNQQIKEIFFEAALLDEKTLKERCEVVLKYWNIEDLMYLVKRHLFSNLPYYSPVEAIKVAVDTLGAEKTIEFFHVHPFFITYRAKEYRSLSADVMLHEEALKALEDFKNRI